MYVASTVNESTRRPSEMQSKLLRPGRNAQGAEPFQRISMTPVLSRIVAGRAFSRAPRGSGERL